MNYDIETFDYAGSQYIITDASDIKLSSHYGEDGSGFGYLKFTLQRAVGVRYNDIGFLYRAKVRKGLKVIYDGMIRQIGESTKDGVGSIDVAAVGYAIVAEDAPEMLRNFCNTSLSEWVVPGQIPGALYRPDVFGTQSSSGGLILSATTQEVEIDNYTELEFEFYPGEVAERFKCSTFVNLGRGVAFDADVDSVDEGNSYIYYKNNSDETKIAAGMTLFNITQGLSTTVDAVNTASNRLTVNSSPRSWVSDDEIYVNGPFFTATILSVTGQNVIYSNDVGEDNISTAYTLVNLTKKESAGITGINTVSDTITTSGDISTWSQNDVIIIPAPLFSATVSGVSGTQITYSGEAGERVVNSDTGWVLYNVNEDDVATVASWTAPNKLDVTVSGEISSWTGDTIHIYAPYRVELRDSNDNVLWPSNWRSGAIPGVTASINVTTTGSPDKFRVLFKSYMAGVGDDSSFARVYNVKAYSTIDDVTMETMSKDMLADLATLGIDSSEAEISAIAKVIEPSVFEFKDIKASASETARFGSQNGNRVAWGIRPDDRKRFFVEEFPTETKYVIAKSVGSSDVEISADAAESVQRLRGVYTNFLGERVIMDWEEDAEAYFGTYYISRTESMSNIDNGTDAQAYLQLMLGEHARPPVSASYVTKGEVVRDGYGATIPFDEIVADGTFIEVEDFRSAITGTVTNDLSANWVKDRLVAVEIDLSNNSVKMIPGKAIKTFEVYMAELSRIAKL